MTGCNKSRHVCLEMMKVVLGNVGLEGYNKKSHEYKAQKTTVWTIYSTEMGDQLKPETVSFSHAIQMIYSLYEDRKKDSVCLYEHTFVTLPLCQHVQMFPDYNFPDSIPLFLHHPSSFILLSCPTDLLLLICVISTFYLLSLSPSMSSSMYLSVHHSFFPFNLLSDTKWYFWTCLV